MVFLYHLLPQNLRHKFRQNPTKSDICTEIFYVLISVFYGFPPRPLLLLVPALDIFPAARYNTQISIQIPRAPLLLVEVLAGAMRGWLNIPMTGFGRFKLSRQDTHTLPTVGL